MAASPALLCFLPHNKSNVTRMKILVNNKERESKAQTLTLLLEELGLPSMGLAVAVNNRMVPRTQWDSYALDEGINVVIIKAACGG